jgi:hypothetical protein
METDDTYHPADTPTNGGPDYIDEVAHFVEHGVDSVVGGVADELHHVLDPQVTVPSTEITGITWPELPTFPATLINSPLLAPSAASVIGDPADDVNFWHLQSDSTTCAIDAQQFVLEQLTGQQFSEQQLLTLATDHGWYSDGTPPEDCGNLLQLFGLTVEHRSGASIDDVADQLAQGHGVIVGVNAEKIWGIPQQDPATTTLASIPVIPGQDADHAVEVIGIDKTDPSHPMVILNDSGTPNGAGEMVPLSTFLDAWASSGNMMVDAF